MPHSIGGPILPCQALSITGSDFLLGTLGNVTTSPLPHTLGDRVRTLRKKLGLSQKALAEAAGLQQGSLSDIETGVTTPEKIRASTLQSLARHLKTTTEYLVRGTPGPAPLVPTEPEAELVAIFRCLPPKGRAHLLDQAKSLQALFTPKQEKSEQLVNSL